MRRLLVLAMLVGCGSDDGPQCVHQHFSHFQPQPMMVGKIMTIQQHPVYRCDAWIGVRGDSIFVLHDERTTVITQEGTR